MIRLTRLYDLSPQADDGDERRQHARDIDPSPRRLVATEGAPREWYVIDADCSAPNPDGSPYELAHVCDGPFEQSKAEAIAAFRNETRPQSDAGLVNGFLKGLN